MMQNANPTPSESRSATSTRRLLVYAHFDPDGVVHDYVVHTLRAMRPACSSVRFVTTSRLPQAEMAKVEPHVDERSEAPNVGFDFAMWKSCLRPADFDAFDEIVLTNSSVYGPFCDAASLFETMRDRPCDAWGITESLEQDRHLQSYFIVFRKSVLVSDAFRAFWDSVLSYPNKRQVIRSYEIGLSQWLIASGFTLAALCPWRHVVRYLMARPRHASPISQGVPGLPRLALGSLAFCRRHLHRVRVPPRNPSVAFPEELIDLGVPFLKLEVVRDNPFNLDIAAIRARLKSLGYPTEYLLPARRNVVPGAMATTPATGCPMCGTPGEVVHAGRADAFGEGSPAVWNIRKCRERSCGCAWLDPVPLETEIHQAYTSYYTHANGLGTTRYFPPAYGRLDRLLLSLFNACLGALRLGGQRQDYWLHGLTHGGGRLLEVGCGDGSRLLELQKRGWEAEGLEVDARAASHARSKGLRIHERSIEEAGLPEGAYDVILMSHVLEHLHRPLDLLRECRKLLRPGGRLVISTPNVESLGHLIYKRDWLGLDSPRHLVIHSRRSLRSALRQAGFGETSIRTVPLNCELISMHSRDIKYLGWTDMDSGPRVGRELVPVAVQLAAMVLHRIAPASGEECFAVAVKPDRGSERGAE